MDSTRQQKFARLIQKELSNIFIYDTKHLFGNAFITVSGVRVSPDLGLAKVYLSFLMAPDKEKMLELIQDNTKFVRKQLGNKIGKQARIIPELVFYIDDGVDYAQKMEDIFNKIDIPKKDENEATDE